MASAVPTTKAADGAICGAHFSMASDGLQPDATAGKIGERFGGYTGAAADIERTLKGSGPG